MLSDSDWLLNIKPTLSDIKSFKLRYFSKKRLKWWPFPKQTDICADLKNGHKGMNSYIFLKSPNYLRPNQHSRLGKRFKIGHETIHGFHTSDR